MFIQRHWIYIDSLREFSTAKFSSLQKKRGFIYKGDKLKIHHNLGYRKRTHISFLLNEMKDKAGAAWLWSFW